MEDGTVQGFDVRTAKSDSASESKPAFTLHAHDRAVCAISYNPLVPNVYIHLVTLLAMLFTCLLPIFGLCNFLFLIFSAAACDGI